MTRNEQIGQYVNDTFGYFDYFDTRAFVKSAMDNTLQKDYPNVPYTAKEVIEWAKWNDKNSFFMTAGKQAIDGETTAQKIFGTPDINPLTEKANTAEAKAGIIGKAGNTLFKGVLYVAGGLLLFQYLKKRV